MGVIRKAGDTYTLADVDGIIDGGLLESEHLDYKADPHVYNNPKVDPIAKIQSITAKAVCAFANSGGGTLLLGVDEGPNGEPLRTAPPGMTALVGKDNIVERVDRMITNSTEPRAPAHVDQVLITAERAYVIVDVSQQGRGPYRVVRTQDASLDDRYFIRVGRQSLIADHHQLRQLFAQSAASAQDVRAYLERHGFAAARRRRTLRAARIESGQASSVPVRRAPSIRRETVRSMTIASISQSPNE